MARMDRTRARAILDEIHFRGWDIELAEPVPDQLQMRLVFIAPDAVTGEPARQECRWWVIPADATTSQLVLSVWAAVEMAITHEAREDFIYRGRRILGPHVSVDGLWESARRLDL